METIQTKPPGVGDLFSMFGPEYRKKHKLPLQHLKTMFAIEHCRSSVLGGHIDQCNSCEHERIFYNSCRNRHCPKCQRLKQAKWIDKLSANLLPVRYFHIVFTIPSELNRLALVNQKIVYDILFQSASESLLMLAKDEKHLHALTGMVAVLHTWGQNLMEHPHLHTLVPAGGWSEIAQSWQHSKKKFFLPVKVISAVFKGKFLGLLKRAHKENQLKFEGEIGPLRLKKNFKQLLDTLYNKDWVVYAKKPFKNAGHIINYLGRYTHKVAISNERIVGTDNKNVSFKWKDYRNQGSKGTMTLEGGEFIRRFLLHVLPKGFCKIRYYGIFAPRTRKNILPLCRNAIGKVVLKSKFANLTWQESLKLVSGIDVSVCPKCKTGKMELYLLLKSKRPAAPS